MSSSARTSSQTSLCIELSTENYIMEQMTEIILKSVLRILSLVTASSEHCTSLCKGSESDCHVSMIIRILHSCIKHAATYEASGVGCESMSS